MDGHHVDMYVGAVLKHSTLTSSRCYGKVDSASVMAKNLVAFRSDLNEKAGIADVFTGLMEKSVTSNRLLRELEEEWAEGQAAEEKVNFANVLASAGEGLAEGWKKWIDDFKLIMKEFYDLKEEFCQKKSEGMIHCSWPEFYHDKNKLLQSMSQANPTCVSYRLYVFFALFMASSCELALPATYLQCVIFPN